MKKRYAIARLKPRGLKSISAQLSRRATMLDNVAWNLEISYPKEFEAQIHKLRRIAKYLRALGQYIFNQEKRLRIL